MALTETRTLTNEADEFFALGPIPSGSKAWRLRLTFTTDGTGTPIADYYNLTFSMALCTADTLSEANINSGAAVLGNSRLQGSNGGGYISTASNLYGTTDKASFLPYGTVGQSGEYILPVPEFSGADRYLVIWMNSANDATNAVSIVTVTLEHLNQPVTVPKPVFIQGSWVSANPASGGPAFQNIGPYSFARRARLRIDFNSDKNGTTDIFTVSQTASSDKDQTAFAAGTVVAPSQSIAIGVGNTITRWVSLPAASANRYALIKFEDGTADNHSAIVMTVLPPVRTLRSRLGSSRRGLGPR